MLSKNAGPRSVVREPVNRDSEPAQTGPQGREKKASRSKSSVSKGCGRPSSPRSSSPPNRAACRSATSRSVPSLLRKIHAAAPLPTTRTSGAAQSRSWDQPRPRINRIGWQPSPSGVTRVSPPSITTDPSLRCRSCSGLRLPSCSLRCLLFLPPLHQTQQQQHVPQPPLPRASG